MLMYESDRDACYSRRRGIATGGSCHAHAHAGAPTTVSTDTTSSSGVCTAAPAANPTFAAHPSSSATVTYALFTSTAADAGHRIAPAHAAAGVA